MRWMFTPHIPPAPSYPPGEPPRFVIDNHLGRLAIYLRILGFDSLYRNDYQDEELAQVAEAELRVLLTRRPPAADAQNRWPTATACAAWTP